MGFRRLLMEEAIWSLEGVIRILHTAGGGVGLGIGQALGDHIAEAVILPGSAKLTSATVGVTIPTAPPRGTVVVNDASVFEVRSIIVSAENHGLNLAWCDGSTRLVDAIHFWRLTANHSRPTGTTRHQRQNKSRQHGPSESASHFRLPDDDLRLYRVLPVYSQTTPSASTVGTNPAERNELHSHGCWYYRQEVVLARTNLMFVISVLTGGAPSPCRLRLIGINYRARGFWEGATVICVSP